MKASEIHEHAVGFVAANSEQPLAVFCDSAKLRVAAMGIDSEDAECFFYLVITMLEAELMGNMQGAYSSLLESLWDNEG